jgi:hypothetical protein
VAIAATRRLGGVVPGALFGQCGDRLVQSAPAPAALVDRPVSRDTEQPHLELLGVPGETAQITRSLQPGLGGDVLAGPGDQDSEISQQRRVEGAPEHGEARLVSAHGAVEGVRYVLPIQHWGP